MPKYTAGPWTENACEVQAPDGSPVCEMLARPEDKDRWVSANGGVADANSRLICAAPDLLAALEGLIAAFDSDFHDLMLAKMKAQAAIAKAKGGE